MNTYDPKKKKKDDLELIEELMKERLETCENCIYLFKKMDQMDLLEEMLFKQHDKVLLPIVLLNIKKKEIEEKKKALTSKKNLMAYGVKHSEERMTPEQAYNSLVKHQPKTELEEAVRSFMLKNVPDYFKNLKNNQKPTTKTKVDKATVNEAEVQQLRLDSIEEHPVEAENQLIKSGRKKGKGITKSRRKLSDHLEVVGKRARRRKSKRSKSRIIPKNKKNKLEGPLDHSLGIGDHKDLGSSLKVTYSRREVMVPNEIKNDSQGV